MLFEADITVNFRPRLVEQADAIKATEKACSQKLQRRAIWPHIWRVAGTYSNLSIFDVFETPSCSS